MHLWWLRMSMALTCSTGIWLSPCTNSGYRFNSRIFAARSAKALVSSVLPISSPPAPRTNQPGLTTTGLLCEETVFSMESGICVPIDSDAYTNTFGTENSILRLENTTLWTENPINA